MSFLFDLHICKLSLVNDHQLAQFLHQKWSGSKLFRIVSTVCAIVAVTTTIGATYRCFKIYYCRKKYKYPPGLYGVPLFGSFLTAQAAGADFLNKIIPSYGPLVHMPAGSFYDFVQINDGNLMQKVFTIAVDRPDWTATASDALESDLSLVNDDRGWHTRRKTLMHCITKVVDKLRIHTL